MLFLLDEKVLLQTALRLGRGVLLCPRSTSFLSNHFREAYLSIEAYMTHQKPD